MDNRLNEKRISIIIPCYNSKEYLPVCLKSLEQQTIGLSSLEVILINDASTDDTWDVIREFEKKYPESVVAIDLPENKRQGGARNVGLQYATGEFIAFLDSDDMVVSDAYEKLYHYAVTSGADIVQFNHYNLRNNSLELCDNCKKNALVELKTISERKAFLISELLTMGCWNKLYRHEMVKESQARYAENCIYEEPMFVYPQLFMARKILFVTDVFYVIRIHSQSTTQSEIKRPGRLLEHPQVQFMLLEYLVQRKELLEVYYEEIEYYFLTTYYIETLCFAGAGNLLLPVEYFKNMQENVWELFPTWRKNPYIARLKEDIRNIFETSGQEYGQEELDELCQKVSRAVLE